MESSTLVIPGGARKCGSGGGRTLRCIQGFAFFAFLLFEPIKPIKMSRAPARRPLAAQRPGAAYMFLKRDGQL